jgi:hypothetical protein
MILLALESLSRLPTVPRGTRVVLSSFASWTGPEPPTQLGEPPAPARGVRPVDRDPARWRLELTGQGLAGHAISCPTDDKPLPAIDGVESYLTGHVMWKTCAVWLVSSSVCGARA